MVLLFATLDAGEIEHVVNEAAETSGFSGDDAEIRALLDRVIHAPLGEQFREHANRSERGFQFVGNVADEIGFLASESQLTVEIANNKPATDSNRQYKQSNYCAQRQLESVSRARQFCRVK